MAPLPLIFLLFSTASAFSPTALPPSQQLAINISPRWSSSSSHPLSRCSLVGRSSNNAKQPLPLLSRNVNSNGNTNFRTTSSLSMAASVAAEQPKSTYKKRIAIFMAFMTGWADFMFIKKYNFFATMMTGNSMKMAWALVDGRIRDTFFFLSIIASYIFGVGIYRRVELSFKDQSLNGLFAPIVAGCFLCSDYLSWIKPSCTFIPAILLSFAWAIINSVGSEVTGTLMFVVTGAMTRLSNMIVDRISRTAGRKKIPKEGFLMSLSVIGGFILGAGWSAFLTKKAPKLTTYGAFSIMGGIYGLLFLWLDREELGAWWSMNDGKLCEIDSDEVDCK